MILRVIYEIVPSKIKREYRLDGWQIGIKNRGYCSLSFPEEFNLNKAKAIIRRKLGMLPLDY